MDYSNNYMAQDVAAGAAGVSMAIFGGLLLIWFLFVLAIYVYFAICLRKIAQKTNTPNGWFAWIPILNMILLIQIVKRPIWWLILFFIPFANIVFMIIVWMDVAVARNKPNWLGVLMIVPVANLIVPGYLAFSD